MGASVKALAAVVKLQATAVNFKCVNFLNCYIILIKRMKPNILEDQMKIDLHKALDLRKSGEYIASNELLLKLVMIYPDDAVISYQCAWSFDLLGDEMNAIPYYEKAIQLGLPSKDLEEAYIGLGNSYRTLGEYEKSKDVFLQGIEAFPTSQVLKTFYSMTLYNLNEHSQAMEILLKCLIQTTNDKEILSYKKAIELYAGQLDRIWK